MVDKSLLQELEKQSKKVKEEPVFKPFSPWTGLTPYEIQIIEKVKIKHGIAKANDMRKDYLFSKDTEAIQFINYLANREP